MTDPTGATVRQGTIPTPDQPGKLARCPYCGTVEDHIYLHLESRHEAGSWATRQGGEVIAAQSTPGICPVCECVADNRRQHILDNHRHIAAVALTDVEKIGPGRSALYVVAIWPIDSVHRGTINALVGNRTKNAAKSVTMSLRRAESAGMVTRDGDWIRRIDQTALMRRALDGIQDPGHEKLLDLANASRRIRNEIAAESNVEVVRRREDELRFIQSLMRPYEGPMTGARRPVRIVASGRV